MPVLSICFFLLGWGPQWEELLVTWQHVGGRRSAWAIRPPHVKNYALGKARKKVESGVVVAYVRDDLHPPFCGTAGFDAELLLVHGISLKSAMCVDKTKSSTKRNGVNFWDQGFCFPFFPIFFLSFYLFFEDRSGTRKYSKINQLDMVRRAVSFDFIYLYDDMILSILNIITLMTLFCVSLKIYHINVDSCHHLYIMNLPLL